MRDGHRDAGQAPVVTAVRRGVLECIGGTRMVALHHAGPGRGARILLKLESENPTGSMKDRMALSMIEAAERDGRLPAGGPVVEYTTGSTGAALALVCRVKGHPLHLVTADAYAQEKRDSIAIYGPQMHVLTGHGGMTEALTLAMVGEARAIAARTGAYWTDQLRNTDQTLGYETLAAEIWEQTGGRVDAFVQSVGTAGSIRGTAAGLRRRNPAVTIVAVEPAESPVLSGGSKGSHGIDGTGAGFVVPLWQPDIANRIERVSTDEAKAMVLHLARTEGLFAGTSTGANVVAATRVAAALGPEATVVTLMCDTGIKYLTMYGARLRSA
ncbi:MAG: PLP-dependent cysteine synthase family protein [Vicinamibacterales bacterium]